LKHEHAGDFKEPCVFCLRQSTAGDTALVHSDAHRRYLRASGCINSCTIAIIRTVKSNTEFPLLGVKLSTGVGVALLGIGLLLAYVTVLWWGF
jgi:hypothetical protein